MTCANVLVGLGEIVKGWRRCGYLCRSAKGATVAGSPHTLISSFQSTLPRRERPGPKQVTPGMQIFQSTLPRSERPSVPACPDRHPAISIHAPVKGATRVTDAPTGANGISIRAPAKGATKALQAEVDGYIISIHAPVKGATISLSRISSYAQFQSTLPRRERHRELIWQNRHTGISIHAPVKGATPKPRHTRRGPQDFNPRSREGSDSKNHQDYP